MNNNAHRPGPLAHNIVLRVVLYYAAIAGVVGLIWWLLPGTARALVGSSVAALRDLPSVPGADLLTSQAPTGSPLSTALAVAIATGSALLLALPIAWVYMFTRQKRGYRQSVVHSLVLLPVVVAGVVVLVKNSIALAFSLAGIVAAVRFRNTLEDSKDAVYVFLATALGLAAGVQLDVAVVFSIVFISVALGLWYTDFARTPPGLEGERARRQMERALAIANRTGQFVARIDREVLEEMAPEQLDALSRRVARRMEDAEEVPEGKYDGHVRITASDEDSLRPVLEPVLESHCKRWRLEGSTVAGDGLAVLDYEVRLRKGRTLDQLTAALQRDGVPYVVRAEWDAVRR